MDQKLTPQKSNVEFPSLKNFQTALTNNMKNTPKNLDLNQATQKYTCHIFLLPQKTRNKKKTRRVQNVINFKCYDVSILCLSHFLEAIRHKNSILITDN